MVSGQFFFTFIFFIRFIHKIKQMLIIEKLYGSHCMKCIFNVCFLRHWPISRHTTASNVSVVLKLTSSMVFIFLIWPNTQLLPVWDMAASVRRKFLPFGSWCDSSLESHKSGSLLPDGVISSETQCSPTNVGNIKWHSHPSDGLAPSEMQLSRLERDRWCLTSLTWRSLFYCAGMVIKPSVL